MSYLSTQPICEMSTVTVQPVTGGVVAVNPDGTVVSVQPDGSIQSRPPGTHGPYEVAQQVASDQLLYTPVLNAKAYLFSVKG